MINIFSNHEFSITMLAAYSLGCVLYSLLAIILLAWVVVLFKSFTQLRRKVKHSIQSAVNQDSLLEALNSKVEYRKYVFLFAIVLSELVSSFLTIAKMIESLEIVTGEYIHNSKNNISNMNTSNHTHSHSGNNQNYCNTSHSTGMWGYYSGLMTRTVADIFVIPTILTFSLVYTLMAYYATVTNKSLNYNTSLKSVDLTRKHKVLLSSSALTCVILSLLIMIEQTYLIYALINLCVFASQLALTIYYTRRLVRVINWKILDTKIAFGTNHHLYQSYTKSLRSFKLFARIYIFLVASFCIFNVLRSLIVLVTVTNLYILYKVYGICIPIQEPEIYLNILSTTIQVLSVFSKVFLSFSFLLLLSLNLLTLPYLLSIMKLRCNFNFQRNPRNLRQPLLQ